MASPLRHICALTLLAALLPLAACGSDPDTGETEVGEVVAARAGVDTTGAPEAFLMLPSGRLDVRAGRPVDTIPADETTERRERKAPEGGVFVPFTWSYQTAMMEELLPIFGRPSTVDMTLIIDGEYYKQAPATLGRDGQNAVAYWVAVEGSGEDVKLEVQYDGLRQKINLRTGIRSAELAKPLYSLDIKGYSPKQASCRNASYVDEGPAVQVTFTCAVSEVLVVPYVEGEWAPEGKAFAVIGLTTTLSAVNVFGTPGSAAIYSVVSSKDKTELAGQRATRVIDEQTMAGTDSGLLVFTIDAGTVPRELDFHRTYQLLRTAKQGTLNAPSERQIDLRGSIPLT